MKRRIVCIILTMVMLLGALPRYSMTAHAVEMSVSDNFFTLLEAYEGFYAQPYEDYSQWSIGYGSFLAPNDGTPETLALVEHYQQNPITKEQAREWMRKELTSYTNPVNKFLTSHNLTIPQHQFDALISFSYNCGAGWTYETDGNFHKAVEQGNLEDYLLYGMGLWSSAGEGDYILIQRRLSEANLYINGVYEPFNYPANFRYVFLEGAGGTSRYRIHCYDSNDGGTGNGIYTEFKTYPMGPDENGVNVTYVFDGWYTERSGGTRVEVLDGTLADGTVLYAHWKTPNGTPIVIPEPETGMKLKVTVTTTDSKIHTGPGTYYSHIGNVTTGDELEITLTGTSRGALWGRFEGGWVRLDDTNYYTALTEALPRWGVVTADKVNVRAKPGANVSNNPAIAQKNNGEYVQVTQWQHKEGMMWGRIAEGWICLQYVQLNPDNYNGKIVSVELESPPTKTTYVQKAENLDLSGGLLKVTYEDTTVKSIPLVMSTVTGFDNSQLGTKTITATCGGFSVTFDVQIVKATVVFKNYDGSVVSSAEYAYGEKVTVPPNPSRPVDSGGSYYFAGWDKAVAQVCTGSAVYTAKYGLMGDTDGSNKVNEDDAIRLLQHVLFPDMYEAQGYADINMDGVLNEDDAIYLLNHVLFPQQYPLKNP